MLYVYHVVTEREMELNQVIEFNENTHSRRRKALGQRYEI